MIDRNSSVNPGETVAQATLTFDLTDPEQRQRLQRMLAADDLCCVIWDVQQYLRDLVKNDRRPGGESVADTLYSVEQSVYELLERWPHAHAVMEEWT